MAHWISNKLKVAETFLQQIDQQAAESLGKGDKPRSEDPQIDGPSKSSGSVSLKDQLKKRTQEINDYRGKLQSDPNVKNVYNRNNSFTSSKETKHKSTLTDSDWTELLGTPDKGLSLGNVRKDERRRQGGTLGNRNRKINKNSSLIKSGWSKVNGGNKPSDGDESGSSGRSSSVELQNDGKNINGQDVKPQDGRSKENDDVKKNSRLEMVSVPGKVDAFSDVKIGMNDVDGRLPSNIRGNHKSNEGIRASVLNDSKRGSSSTSEDGSDSNSDSSSSESESEREREERRKLREKILAEKAAAKAGDAIKERENMVARLEGEKQSLEKILEERAKQQVKEASELQTSMMETMDAVELEKQRHNNTRMEALQLLAKLETANADLARALAAAQKKLEMETNQVAELRQQTELKEVAHEELSQRNSNTHQTGIYLKRVSYICQSPLAASKGVEFEREILEAEYTFIADKIIQLEDKAKKLEGNIEMTRKEIEDPTEVEIELKRRLGQLTDHLIQKQAQVEALSSEKATLAFRIEAVSRLLDENKPVTGSSSRDLEFGAWDLSQSNLRPLFEEKIRSGKKHIGSLLKQLDSIFLAGVVFLRRNPIAKLWSLVYLVCLHLWVIYILLSHSQSSAEARSGAVFSLENINNTASL
ncbi:Golgin candidate 2 [Citrus sinensis]|uniref:golgin candidate 2 isoform X1 n=1 Tax=Citrus clementina TaxID=85681 RepID=UPI000CED7427|nr:golgin candidate 2 isoform X1 [Citrus x clementina]XP_052291123.1 golgin candidate 2 isoform X1 [Citrus sinensis]KAH9763522.1 Golgin candidate 2 [Citrus sinensis]